MPSRRAFLGGVGGAALVPVIGAGYCNQTGCAGIRNDLIEESPASERWETELLGVHSYDMAADGERLFYATKGGVDVVDKDTGSDSPLKALGPKVNSSFDSLYRVDDYVIGVASSNARADNGWVVFESDGGPSASDYTMRRWGIGGTVNRYIATDFPILVVPVGNRLRAYDITTQEEVWEIDATEARNCAIGNEKFFLARYARDEDTLFLGTADIRSVKSSDSGEISEIDMQVDRNIRGATYHDGSFYILTHNKIIAVSPNRSIRWRWTTPDSGYIAPNRPRYGLNPSRPVAFDGDDIIVKTGTGYVSVVSAGDGRMRWGREFDTPVRQVAASDDAVYVAHNTNTRLDQMTGTAMTVAAFNRDDGSYLGTRAYERAIRTIMGGSDAVYPLLNRNVITSISV
jgi:outer membrane protein assembly factor BamB